MPLWLEDAYASLRKKLDAEMKVSELPDCYRDGTFSQKQPSPFLSLRTKIQPSPTVFYEHYR